VGSVSNKVMIWIKATCSLYTLKCQVFKAHIILSQMEKHEMTMWDQCVFVHFLKGNTYLWNWFPVSRSKADGKLAADGHYLVDCLKPFQRHSNRQNIKNDTRIWIEAIFFTQMDDIYCTHWVTEDRVTVTHDNLILPLYSTIRCIRELVKNK